MKEMERFSIFFRTLCLIARDKIHRPSDDSYRRARQKLSSWKDFSLTIVGFAIRLQREIMSQMI